MSARLEEIDELRKRANVSYEDAREALERFNGDMIEALIYLEKQNKLKSNQCSSFFDKVKHIVKKGNNTLMTFRKRERIVVSLPVTIAVLITVFAPYITFIGVILALVTGHRIKFEGKEGENDSVRVNNALERVSDMVDSAKKKMAEDMNGQPQSK
jgi:hypothetical protein